MSPTSDYPTASLDIGNEEVTPSFHKRGSLRNGEVVVSLKFHTFLPLAKASRTFSACSDRIGDTMTSPRANVDLRVKNVFRIWIFWYKHKQRKILKINRKTPKSKEENILMITMTK